MNKYFITLAVFIILYIICMAIIQKILTRDDKLKVLKSRNNRNNRSIRHSTVSVKKQLENALNEKVDITKKFKVETLCIQAGYKLSYGEFKIIRVASAIIMPLLMLLLLNNPILAIVFAFIGYNIPYQYIKYTANKRILKMETQVGSFIKIVIERYKLNRDLPKSIVQSLPDFRGQEPFYKELKSAVGDIQIGLPTETVLDNLARSTGSKYLQRFKDYYKISNNIATHEDKVELLNQAFLQFDENRKIKMLLKKEISGPVREAYVMVLAIPIFMAYQSISAEGYLNFMINNRVGQYGIAGVVTVLLGCIWFINAKIGAPLD